jgi:hypothetical protein
LPAAASCPACKADLVARKGRTEHHFAHHANKSCVHAYETAIHKRAKQVIEENRQVGLPAVVAVVGDERHHLYRERIFELMDVVLEQWLEGIRLVADAWGEQA